MNFRVIELQETEVAGISRVYNGQNYNNREELRSQMGSAECDDVPGQLCAGGWNQPENYTYDGEWYGIWQNGVYMIARTPDMVHAESCETAILPAGTYAAFRTQPGTLAWEEFPKLFEEIFDAWLPASDYSLQSETIVEVYHLWTDHDQRKHHRYFEVWIPITAK